MARALLEARMLTGLPPYDEIVQEVKLAAPRLAGPVSRVDFVLQDSCAAADCHLEVKSVTLAATTQVRGGGGGDGYVIVVSVVKRHMLGLYMICLSLSTTLFSAS